MKKKIVALLLLGTMLVSSLAGCAGSSNEPAEDANAEAEAEEEADAAEEEETADEEPVNLVWYQFVNQTMADEEAVMEAVNEYLLEKINVTVDATFLTPEDYQSKMPVIISSGQEFDVCFSTSWLVNYNEYSAKGAFMEINDLLETHAPETLELVPETYWEGMTIDGKIYGVPGLKEGGNQYGLLYNKDIADELGLDMDSVTTFEDLTDIFAQIKAADPEILPTSNNLYNLKFAHEHTSGDWVLPGVTDVEGVDLYAEDNGEIINQYASQEFMDFALLVRDWYENDYVPKDPANYSYSEDFTNGKLFSVAIMYAPACLPSLEATFGHSLGYIPMSDPIQETANVTGGSIHCISYNCEYPEKAMEFINLLNTDEYLGTLIRHGIEGTHYEVSGDQISVLGDPASPAYEHGSGWFFGSVYNQKWTDTFPTDVVEQYQDFNNVLRAGAALGFTFNQEPVKNEIAALNNVIAEFLTPIAGGVVDPEVYVPQFLEKLEANGLEAYMTELQSQFDAWSATK